MVHFIFTYIKNDYYIDMDILRGVKCQNYVIVIKTDIKLNLINVLRSTYMTRKIFGIFII